MIALVIVAKAGVLALSGYAVWLVLRFGHEQVGQVRSDPKPDERVTDATLERYRREVS